ncbi:MAG: ATP-binding protein [Actinomycetota bacterium]
MSVLNQPIELKIPAKPEYVSIARLIAAAFAGLLGFDSEAVDDIKIAISEACTSAIIHLHKQAEDEEKLIDVLLYVAANKLLLDIKYSLREVTPLEKTAAQLYDRDLGMSVLTSLMDKVEIIKVKGNGVIIRLLKKIPAYS